MNEIIPIKEEMSLPRRYGLVPENMGEAMKLADMMAGAKLVPAALQKSPADCLMVIQQAIRWDMDPFAVAQECSVIQGKLMHSGKLVAAVVNARGNLTQRLSFEYAGAGDARTITVSGQLQGEPAPRVVAVTLGNAKTANSMWQKQADQQLMYHGVRVWARRHTPELMLGVYSPEEFEEAAPRRPAKPAPNVMLDHDPKTGEVSPPPKSADQPTASEELKPDAVGSVYPPYTADEYILEWEEKVQIATDPKALVQEWNSKMQKQIRRNTFDDDDKALHALIKKVADRAGELKKVAA